MLIQARRLALYQATAAITAVTLFLVSCNEAASPTSRQSNHRIDKHTEDLDYNVPVPGLEAYKALFQGRGELAADVPFVRDNYQTSLFITTAQEDSIYNAFSDQMIDAINDVDSTFFADFQAHITSGDPFAVEDGLRRAASVTLQAALTIPEVRQH